MSCYFYLLILQVFTPMYVSLNIHVLTCVNVPIKLGHVNTQNKCHFTDSYIIDHSFVYVCISQVLNILIYIAIIIMIMLKSIQSCAAHVHFKTSHTKDYHVHKINTITVVL